MAQRSWLVASAVTTSHLAVIACSSSTPTPTAPTASSGEVATSRAAPSASSGWAPLVAASVIPPHADDPLSPAQEQIVLTAPIQFVTGMPTLREDLSHDLLDALARRILGDPTMTLVRIEGHSDSQGNDQRNLELTDKRAQAVMEALVSRGVERGRLIAVGYGEARPIADNRTAEGRALNRRIEVYIAARRREP